MTMTDRQQGDRQRGDDGDRNVGSGVMCMVSPMCAAEGPGRGLIERIK